MSISSLITPFSQCQTIVMHRPLLHPYTMLYPTFPLLASQESVVVQVNCFKKNYSPTLYNVPRTTNTVVSFIIIHNNNTRMYVRV